MDVLSNPYFLFILSTYLIWRASSVFDVAASYLTRDLKPGIKGPTINAIASSLPELIISCIFLLKFKDIVGFSAGFATIVGSSMFNIALIPTIAFLVVYFQRKHSVFTTHKNIILQDGLFLIFAELLLLGAMYTAGISRTMALLLMGIYAIYLIYIYRSRMKDGDDEMVVTEEYEIEHMGWLKNALLLNLFPFFNRKGEINSLTAIVVALISVGIIGWSCNSLVLACETFAHDLGIGLFVVSFVVAAIASSFPDTLLSIKDAQKGKFKDAFSNAYGSNIFDICICIGLPVFVFLIHSGHDQLEGISANHLVLSSALLLVVFTIIISFLYYISDIKLWNSLVIIGLYGVFLGSVLWLSNHPEILAGVLNNW